MMGSRQYNNNDDHNIAGWERFCLLPGDTAAEFCAGDTNSVRSCSSDGDGDGTVKFSLQELCLRLGRSKGTWRAILSTIFAPKAVLPFLCR